MSVGRIQWNAGKIRTGTKECVFAAAGTQTSAPNA